MKVLLISPKMKKSNGGIATWTNIYLSACPSNDFEVSVLNTEPIGVRAVNGSAKRNLLDEIVRTRGIFKSLKSLLKNGKYDVAHINSSCGKFGLIRDYFVARKIKRKQKHVKIISHFHCDIPYQVQGGLSFKYLKKLLAVSDKSLVLCENSQKYLKENFDCDSIKVPNFVDEALVSQNEKEINETVEKIFFVGRISIAKGAKEIFELARRFPEISFELAGAPGPEISQWQKPENIVMLGLMSHEDVIKKMDEADLFLFPTHTEGFSMALAEAMSRGLPAVATDVGANKDMLEGKGGFVVKVGDVDGMQNAINELFDKSIRTEMSTWSVQKVRSFYLTELVMKSFAEIYKN